MTISLSILFLLFCYELPLIGFAVQSHIADIYHEPSETVERSGIYIIGIDVETLNNMESKQAVRDQLTNEHKDVLTITEINNSMSYTNKNRTLLSWFGLNAKSPKEKMREDLREYFGKEEQRLTDYFHNDHATGNSAGLAILLTELIINGTFQNHIPIAVTGAINGKGEVTAVGGIKEKIQIAEKSGFQFMIIPSENGKEAETFQKELHANIRILDVNQVDEAVKQINYLNDIYK
ncbi:S16 family serine protease [Peribacillus sp. NPDC097675]|uniref:S16 family serine protease n=1 Tax=Peribacillus sp. NPDC097675 TaxID=3390618 RepID=UPI003CFCBCB6